MEPHRLFDLLEYQKKKFPKEDTFAFKKNGNWKKYSIHEVINICNQVSTALLHLGINKGDKIAIISENRPEWNFVDLGIQQIGAISVPIYPTVTEEDFKFIFKDAEIRLIFVSNKELFERAERAAKGIINIIEIISFNEIQGKKNLYSSLKEISGKDLVTVESFKLKVLQDDVVTLIYTSGTTGNPKGVMLTHHNLLSNVQACAKLMPVNNHHTALSFLPLSHVYERMMSYLYIFCGVSIYYAESIDLISDNLKEVKPNIFVTVPRLLEKVYDKIYAKGAELTGIKRMLFFWALDLGLKFETNKNLGFIYNFQLRIANKIIFNKWREALGGNVIAIVSGGAALQARLGRVFWAANIRILEGYGLTETSPVICVNRWEPKDNRIGTVGPVIEGLKVKIAPDGEILCKGPNIMKGYYKREDLTAEVFDQEGWFKTGDIGELIEDRFLKITDRKKEIFKTSGGKYIAPQVLENKFKESRVIEQIMIIGEGCKFPAALIVPSFSDLKSWCEIKGIPFSTNEKIIKEPLIIEKFQREIDELNDNFAQFEKVKKFVLLNKGWTVESGEMTPTLKLKRKVIIANNANNINEIYRN